MFDIQKFAEEEVKEYGDVLDGEIDDTVEEDLPPIPKELDGIPADIARDIMKDWLKSNSNVANYISEKQKL